MSQISELFVWSIGVLEYRSTGVLEYWDNFQVYEISVFSLLHYSITPSAQLRLLDPLEESLLSCPIQRENNL